MTPNRRYKTRSKSRRSKSRSLETMARAKKLLLLKRQKELTRKKQMLQALMITLLSSSALTTRWRSCRRT